MDRQLYISSGIHSSGKLFVTRIHKYIHRWCLQNTGS